MIQELAMLSSFMIALIGLIMMLFLIFREEAAAAMRSIQSEVVLATGEISENGNFFRLNGDVVVVPDTSQLPWSNLPKHKAQKLRLCYVRT